MTWHRNRPTNEKISRILRRQSRDVLVLVLAVAVTGPLLLLTQYFIAQRATAIYTPAVDTTSRLVITMRWAQSDLRLDRAHRLPGADARLLTRETDARNSLSRLTDLVGDDPEFAPLLADMTRSADQWWTYADSATDTPTAPPGELREAPPENPGERAEFTRLIDSSNALHALAITKREQLRMWRTVILVGGSGLAILLVVVVSRLVIRDNRRTAALIATPIEELDQVARDDAGGGRGTRARADSGPAEVRALAAAFNDLLDTRDAYEQGREEHVRRLEELDRQKDDFVSTVSHELRTPLASIIGYSELLEDGDADELTESQLQVVAVIRRNADRLRGLIEDLLVLSRIEARTLETDHSRVPLDTVVAGVLESLGPVASRAEVTLHDELGTAVVEGDSLQLERAVTNLVSNAIKFTPDSGEVSVRLTTDAGTATVEVADTGIGIPAAEHEHLGTRFFRSSTAQQRSIPGTGLGLSIVRAIAENHEGDLTFDSTEGEGTTFRLTVPLLDEPSATGGGGSAASSR